MTFSSVQTTSNHHRRPGYDKGRGDLVRVIFHNPYNPDDPNSPYIYDVPQRTRKPAKRRNFHPAPVPPVSEQDFSIQNFPEETTSFSENSNSEMNMPSQNWTFPQVSANQGNPTINFQNPFLFSPAWNVPQFPISQEGSTFNWQNSFLFPQYSGQDANSGADNFPELFGNFNRGDAE